MRASVARADGRTRTALGGVVSWTRLYGVPVQPDCANAWPAKKTGVRIHWAT